MIKRKIMIMLATMLIAGATTANAKVQNYVVKNGTKTYSYNVQKLGQSYLDHTEGAEAKLYEEYVKNIKEGDMYAFQEHTGKYVSYNDVVNTFLDASESGQAFNLNEFLKTAKAMKVEGKDNSHHTNEDSTQTDNTLSKGLDFNNYFVDTTKLYTAVGDTFYGKVMFIDYNKSLKALENVQVLNSIEVDCAECSTITMEFPKAVNKGDFTKDTMKTVYATGRTECLEKLEIVSTDGTKATFKFKGTKSLDTVYAMFNIEGMKPVIVPIVKNSSRFKTWYTHDYESKSAYKNCAKNYKDICPQLKYKAEVTYEDLTHLNLIKDLLPKEEYRILKSVKTKIDNYKLLTMNVLNGDSSIRLVDSYALDNDIVKIFHHGGGMVVWVYEKGAKEYSYDDKVPQTGWGYGIEEFC